MQIKFIRLKNKLKGFTFISLLIVLVILGIMAGIAIPAVSHYLKGNSVENGKTTQTIEQQAGSSDLELNTLQLAEEAYMFEHEGIAYTGTISGNAGELARYLYNKPLQGTYAVTQDVNTRAIMITPIPPLSNTATTTW
jgi:Tfp pilus assembly protein PilE